VIAYRDESEWKPVIRAFPIQKWLEHGLSLTGSHNQTASTAAATLGFPLPSLPLNVDLETIIMFIKTFAALLILLNSSIIPTSTSARESSGTTPPTPAEDFTEPELAAIFQEIKAFANVRIAVRDAIKIAEARASGVKVIDVSFDGRSDRDSPTG
jgi:hypothetical protein